MTDILYHLAKCCYPVPGDNLVGFITRGKGVSVHRKSCPNLPRLVADEERLISVQWKASDGAPHLAKVAVDTLDRPGIVANLSAAISSLNINIHHMEAITNQLENAHISFILEVKDRGQLNAIMQKLAQLDGVIGVRR